jgi:hypothetical protein
VIHHHKKLFVVLATGGGVNARLSWPTAHAARPSACWSAECRTAAADDQEFGGCQSTPIWPPCHRYPPAVQRTTTMRPATSSIVESYLPPDGGVPPVRNRPHRSVLSRRIQHDDVHAAVSRAPLGSVLATRGRYSA